MIAIPTRSEMNTTYVWGGLQFQGKPAFSNNDSQIAGNPTECFARNLFRTTVKARDYGLLKKVEEKICNDEIDEVTHDGSCSRGIHGR